MTSLPKGSPLTGRRQGSGSESRLCRQTACVSVPTLSLAAVRPQARGLPCPEPVFPNHKNGDDRSICFIGCCEV